MNARRMFVTTAMAMAMALPVAAQDLTKEEVLAKHYEAIGGLEAWKAIKTVEATGKMTMGPGMEAPFKMTLKRPMKMRIEFSMQGMTGIQAYDGETAWMLMPFMGKTAPEAMSPEMARNVIEQADMDGALIDYESKGHEIEYLGVEQIEGTPAHKLKVTMASGDVRFHYLDLDAFVVFKQTGTTQVQGQEVEFESTLSDYKYVGDIVFPHAIENRPKGAPQGQVITLDSVKLNGDVEDSLFEMPKEEAAAE